jgi:hypothetical protein
MYKYLAIIFLTLTVLLTLGNFKEKKSCACPSSYYFPGSIVKIIIKNSKYKATNNCANFGCAASSPYVIPLETLIPATVFSILYIKTKRNTRNTNKTS